MNLDFDLDLDQSQDAGLKSTVDHLEASCVVAASRVDIHTKPKSAICDPTGRVGVKIVTQKSFGAPLCPQLPMESKYPSDYSKYSNMTKMSNYQSEQCTMSKYPCNYPYEMK